MICHHTLFKISSNKRVKLESLKAVTMKIVHFWAVEFYSLVVMRQIFGGTCYLVPQ
jgi:hypothetical protein